jgi:hypothetical protein
MTEVNPFKQKLRPDKEEKLITRPDEEAFCFRVAIIHWSVVGIYATIKIDRSGPEEVMREWRKEKMRRN